LGADVELGAHDLDRIAHADVIVASPGIPPHAPVLQHLRERGRHWVSEPEFAARFYRSPLIAVTGTNGKTTTTLLIAHLMREGGLEVGVGGNVGGGLAPAASTLALDDPPPAWFVLEVSSFQLADIDEFSPDIGVLTNLAPDHLDRYPDLDAYYGDKARLFKNATPDCRWVLGDQPEVQALPGDHPGARYTFSTTREEGMHAFLRDGVLTLSVEGAEEPLLSRERLPLMGGHNVANALAAALTARLAGVAPSAIARGLATARALPHRMEPVGERDGVIWVNDSKATNVAATVSALTSLDRPAVVLLGGKDKGEDVSPLGPALQGAARAAVCYGAAGPRIAEAIEPGVAVGLIHRATTFVEAVRRGVELARPGDLLLLSPACSSFDEFDNYEARGSRFAALARGEAA
jgi:UDP-N-acetylmuramoylalanine--D-glutamate ligase